MSDPRLIPANTRVAAEHLRGEIKAERYSKGAARQLSVPLADLLHAPGGRRERQVVSGESVTLYDTHDGWSFVQLSRDGYVGYLREDHLMPSKPMTHWVSARATHLYPAPDFKAPEICALSHLSRLQVLAHDGRFVQTPDGFIPHAHLSPLPPQLDDPVAQAEIYLGTPYLWGGNSSFGIDCSGLVQAGCLACAIPCPGDSDMQLADLGHDLANDTPLQRGDLLFWKGHVAWVAGPDRLIHANAYHMAVAYEDTNTAIARIQAQGDGPVIARKRLGGPS